MLLSFASLFSISSNSFLLMLYQSPFLSFTLERVGFPWTSYVPGVGVVQGGEGPESLSRFHNPWKAFLFYCYTDKLLLENMAYLCELLCISEANRTEVHFGLCPTHPSFCTPFFFFRMKNVDIQGKPLSSRKCTFWDLLPLALLVILSMLLFTCFYETLFWATLRYILEAAEYICLFYTWKWSFRDFVFIASFWFWTSSWREGRNTDLHGHICTRHWLFLWILRKLVECAASISLYDTTWSFFSEAAMRVCMHVWVCVRVC